MGESESRLSRNDGKMVKGETGKLTPCQSYGKAVTDEPNACRIKGGIFMYINQLSQEKQDFVKSRLQPFMEATGLEGNLLAEAIQHAMDSKLDDLGDILSYAERQNLKSDEEMDIRKLALERHFETEATELDDSLYEIGYGEYLVLSNWDAKGKAKEAIRDSAWAFNSGFLAELTELPEIIFTTLQPLCEGSNDAILAIIKATCGFPHFASKAIETDGLGHFLAHYDHEEIELEGGYYAYRIN